MLFYCWKTPGSSNMSQTGLDFLFFYQFISLPSSQHAPLRPHYFLLKNPHKKSYSNWVTIAFSSLVIPFFFFFLFSRPKPLCMVSGHESLPVIHPMCVSNQPACLHLQWPHMKVRFQAMWNQMFLLSLDYGWSLRTAFQQTAAASV